MPSPIALFVYNRLRKTQQTIDALRKNNYATESDVLVFSDGPKSEQDRLEVSRVREYVHSVPGFKSVTVIESPINKGLARSIIDGTTFVLQLHDTVIVLEDDMVTSPYFLKYMNTALELYRNEEEVISIHGYVYPVNKDLPDSFFIRGADCWGWATWRRGWELFEANGTKLMEGLERHGLTRDFDFNGSYPFTQMLRDQILGLNDSWAIRWQASAFLNDRLTLYPGKSYIRNIGFDSSGTHSGVTNEYDTELRENDVELELIPAKENLMARSSFEGYFKRIRPSFLNRIKLKFYSMMFGRKRKDTAGTY